MGVYAYRLGNCVSKGLIIMSVCVWRRICPCTESMLLAAREGWLGGFRFVFCEVDFGFLV